MFSYDEFERLCNERKVTPYRVATDTGISTATLSEWKNGAYVPKYNKIAAIAKYFNVPIETFLKKE